MNQAELIATVASAAVRATLTAASGTRSTPKHGHQPLSTPTPITPPRREPVPVDRDALAVAIHEAGHAVSGVVLGADFHTAVVGELPGGLKGQAYFYDRPHGADPLISYAGPYAEARWLAGGRRPTQREFYTVLDGHGCRDRSVLTAAGGFHAGADVEPIVARCWPAVLTVARQLHLTGEVVREDVLAALGVDTTRPVASQLSNIRCGGQTVPAFAPRTPAPA